MNRSFGKVRERERERKRGSYSVRKWECLRCVEQKQAKYSTTRSILTSSCYIHKNSHRKSVKKNQNRFEFTRMNVKSLIYCLYLILSILPKQMIILRSLRILRQMVLNHVVFLCCLQWMRTRKILSFLFRCNIRDISLSLSPSLCAIRVYLWAMMFSRFWLLPFVYAQLPFVSDVSLGLWCCLFVCLCVSVLFSRLVCRLPCSVFVIVVAVDIFICISFAKMSNAY